jgi:hypothetical protein
VEHAAQGPPRLVAWNEELPAVFGEVVEYVREGFMAQVGEALGLALERSAEFPKPGEGLLKPDGAA